MNAYQFAKDHQLAYRTVKVWRDSHQPDRWHFDLVVISRKTGRSIAFTWSPSPLWGYDDCRRPSIARTWDNVMSWYTWCHQYSDPRFPPRDDEGKECLQDYRDFKRIFTRSQQKRLSLDVQQIDPEE